MKPMERPNRRTKPVNEHLGEHELPNQKDEPMEEPEEAGAGARIPSQEYKDLLEVEALMEELEEAESGAQSPILEYVAPGFRSLSPRG